MTTYICPHSELCSVYKNWVEQTHSDRLDIIHSEVNKRYSCLALNSLDDFETGISMNSELKRRLEGTVQKKECGFIELLNNSMKPDAKKI